MFNRQIKINEIEKLRQLLEKPENPGHRRYEALRAIISEELDLETAAKRFHYKPSSLYTMLMDAKNEKTPFFPINPKKKKGRKLDSENCKKVVRLRLDGKSAIEIATELSSDNFTVSGRSVERILNDYGFDKLHRRTNKQLGKSKRGFELPKKAEKIDFDKLEPFSVDCHCAGIFFFIPLIIKSGILEIVEQCALPESSVIDATSAALSMLALKLLGHERLSNIKQYDMEPGFGIFAGLNVLPKTTYMTTYSCRCDEAMMMDFQQKIHRLLVKTYPNKYASGFINMDFHSIPHYGEEDAESLEKVWCGSKHQTLRGATTVLAQDARSNLIMYSRADILRSEEAEEVQNFVDYWRKIKGSLSETLVFDCKFTTYAKLNELDQDNVKFITLRKRNAKLLRDTAKIPDDQWEKVRIPIPKRKHKIAKVHESEITLGGGSARFRQLIVKDHGRAQPTYIVTNDFNLSRKEILTVYAKRWRIENKIAEATAFFNLNALSSPLMVRIHFDLLWTFIADSLYRLFADDLRRFEKLSAPSIFKKFIDMPGRIVFDGENFQIKIRKRSHTPVLMGVANLEEPFRVPWLDNRTVEIVWTA